MDEKELKSWIESTKRTVFLAVLRHLPGHMSHLVEDIAQETYMLFYKHFLIKAPDPELAAGWLYVTASNQAKKAVRKESRENSRILKFAEFYTLRTAGDDVQWNKDEIDEVLKDLPSPYRETMVFRLMGMSITQIANREEIKEGTVKSRLARGRELLSRLISNQE